MTEVDRAKGRRIALELLASWESESGSVTGRAEQVATFVSAWGLASHSHRAGRRVGQMLDDGATIEATPVLRMVYECSITAQWLLRLNTAGDFLAASHQQRKKILNSFREVRPDLMAEREVEEADPITYGMSKDSAERFESRCLDLVGGPGLYMHYRALCSLSHASHYVIDDYLDLPPGSYIPKLRKQPHPDRSASSWLLLALSLVWAGRVITSLNQDKTRRPQLQAAALALDIPLDLKMSEAAWKRLHVAAEPKDRKVGVYFSPAEFERLEDAARARGINVADLLRTLAATEIAKT